MVGVRVGALQAMQEEKVTKKRGITEEDKEEFSHMTETDGLGRYGQMTSLWNLIKNVRAHWHLHGWRSRRR